MSKMTPGKSVLLTVGLALILALPLVLVITEIVPPKKQTQLIGLFVAGVFISGLGLSPLLVSHLTKRRRK